MNLAQTLPVWPCQPADSRQDRPSTSTAKYRQPAVIDAMRAAAFGRWMHPLGSEEEKEAAFGFAPLDASEPYYAALADLALESIAGQANGGPVRVLDVGAGTGRIAYDLARSASTLEVIAVEQSPELVDEIRQVASGVEREVLVPVTARRSIGALLRLPEPAPRLNVIAGDAHDLPVASSTISCALALGLLDRVKRPRSVVAELARVLRPGGFAVVSCLFDFMGGPASEKEWLDRSSDAFTGDAWQSVVSTSRQLALRQNARYVELFCAEVIVAKRA
ncbi:MAG: class I SAM-dependent methyltransferase [Polyangiaceae bacterium]|nr:class I SAM-dependent methyltransferase [Polyangiaceae bacterium]